ncbi:MAG TPA: 5'/3'-nucleotidase SurE [Stellaceae bacterium]|nr:5'/3'-nucleotidase SurE [Stellaceae bacterium]
MGEGLDLRRTRILVCNDDGIEAPGIKLLARIAQQLSDDVWVVAPEQEQSGASHSLTLQRPLRVRQVGRRRFAVDGTPTDCVLLAVNAVLKDVGPPALVLSGINGGGNMGEDVTYSGTVAAAMEASLLGMKAIALSQHIPEDRKVDWSTAAEWAPKVIRRLAALPWPSGTLYNVNFPALKPRAVKGIAPAAQGGRKIGDHLLRRLDPRGRPYYWIGPQRDEEHTRPGSDVHAVAEGYVAVTPVFLDMTNRRALSTLRKALV